LRQDVSGELLKKRIFYLSTEPDRMYSEFIGSNLTRMRGLMALMRLREVGVDALNVPVRYRDQPHITAAEALAIAKRVESEYGMTPVMSDSAGHFPLFWSFPLSGGDGSVVGGHWMVDRVDGHIWSADEKEQYDHDFNNAFWVL
jgi:hypothetical protein